MNKFIKKLFKERKNMCDWKMTLGEKKLQNHKNSQNVLFWFKTLFWLFLLNLGS